MSKIRLVERIVGPKRSYIRIKANRNMGGNRFDHDLTHRRVSYNAAIDPCNVLAKTNPSVIKLDCEGCEYYALKQLGACLTQFPKYVFVEVLGCHNCSDTRNAKTIKKVMRKWPVKYQCISFSNSELILTCNDIPNNVNHGDLLFKKYQNRSNVTP